MSVIAPQVRDAADALSSVGLAKGLGSLYRSAMPSKRYPEVDSMFRAGLEERAQRFMDAREDFLLNYDYNTARAYWGDLDEIYLWCEHREFDIFELTNQQFRQYQALLRRRGYSENTIRRRETAFAGFNHFLSTALSP